MGVDEIGRAFPQRYRIQLFGADPRRIVAMASGVGVPRTRREGWVIGKGYARKGFSDSDEETCVENRGFEASQKGGAQGLTKGSVKAKGSEGGGT